MNLSSLQMMMVRSPWKWEPLLSLICLPMGRRPPEPRERRRRKPRRKPRQRQTDPKQRPESPGPRRNLVETLLMRLAVKLALLMPHRMIPVAMHMAIVTVIVLMRPLAVMKLTRRMATVLVKPRPLAVMKFTRRMATILVKPTLIVEWQQLLA